MAKPKTYNNRRKQIDKRQENDMVKMISNLAEFEKFKDEVLPALRKDLLSGMDAKQLREKYIALAQARQISIAVGSVDEAKSLTAIQSIIDRTEGKATEHKTVKHQFADLKDTELDAILASEEADLNEMEQSTEH
jgi:glucuronate isomerase